MATKPIKCTKCGTQIEPDTAYIEANFGDVFLEDCFVCEKSGIKLDAYVCLNDAGEPRRFKYERGHYFHPDHAPGKATVIDTPLAKADVCYLCETPCDGEECIQLMDGKKIKVECLKKAGIDPNDKSSLRLLRSNIEQLKQGGQVFTGPTEDREEVEAAVKEAFEHRVEEAKKVAEERRKKDEAAAAAKAARQQHFAEVEEQKRKDFEAAKAQEEADKEQAEADKKNRLDAKGKWTIAELKDAQLRKDYFVAELTAGQPETLLSEADFQTALGMDREAFEKLAGWKQKDARKKQGFF